MLINKIFHRFSPYATSYISTRLKIVHAASALSKQVRSMSSSTLESVPKVDIDPYGVFKYILVKVYDKEKDGQEPSVTIVRGYKRCNYHSDIYDEVQEKLQPLDCEPLGGGRISHEPANKKIHIYGYSQGYGKADHEVAAKLVKDAFPGYTITISDEASTTASKIRTKIMLMRDVDRVQIEPFGEFMFLLLKIRDVHPPPRVPSVTIIRGSLKYSKSADILRDTQKAVAPLVCEPLGGGRLNHIPDEATIAFSGESETYGRADPLLVRDVLKMVYPEYQIETPCDMCLPRPID